MGEGARRDFVSLGWMTWNHALPILNIYCLNFVLRTSNFLHLPGTAVRDISEMEESYPSLSHVLIQEVDCF